MVNFEEGKLSIINSLRDAQEPVSLHYLLLKLNNAYPERTLRRWLAELIANGEVEKVGQKRGTKYRVLDTLTKPIAEKAYFSSESSRIIERVRRPLYERMPTAYVDKLFNSYSPQTTRYIPTHTGRQLLLAGKRSKIEDPAGTYAHQIFNRLLIDLSYNSSRLEGNTYSLLDTEKLVLEGTSAAGKLDEEKIMILNHKEAIRYLVDNAPRLTVSAQTIYTLHYLLSDALVEAKYAGKVRDHGVRIGGSTYVPSEDPTWLQSQIERIAHKASQIQNPYEQSIFLLVHITYLQAFADVNKRTARLCANIPLIVNNLVPLSFNDVERDDYTSAILSIYELQNVGPLVDLYAFSYLRTCAMYDSTVKAIGFDEIRVRYRQQRRSLIRDIILQQLVGPSLTQYLSEQIGKLVARVDQDAFLEDVLEDLREMDMSRVAGLGITPDQLDAWLKKYRV